MEQFIFEWDDILFFKGIVKLDEITDAIWEEFLDVKTLADAHQFYTLKIQTTYYHWGRGKDENGDFCQHLLYETNQKGRGSFLVTTIEYTQKQHLKTCQYSKRMHWNQEKQCNEELTKIVPFSMEHWMECRLPNKGDAYFQDHNVCKICKDYVKKETVNE